jgi:hypothetical protein
MYGYMTELHTVDAERTETIIAEGSIITFPYNGCLHLTH